MDRLSLAAHHRDDALGRSINALSRKARPGAGAFGPELHATHVYVVARMGGWDWRLDGDLPKAKWESWRRSNGVHTQAPYAPRLWEFRGGLVPAFRRLADLADKPPPYDLGEVAQQVAAALETLLPRELVRLLPRGLPAKDVVGRMAICTRVAQQVFDVRGLPDLFPETLVRHAEASTDFREVPADELLRTSAWAASG